MSTISSGTTSGLTVSAGVTETVISSGIVVSTTVLNGGTLVVSSGGTDSAATVSSGGNMSVGSGGSASGDQIHGTLTVTGTAATTVTNETVFNGGVLDLFKGTATGTTVDSGGKLYISGGNTASNTTLSSGGTVELNTSGSVLSGSLTFAGGSNTLLLDKILSTSAGDQAVISGFSSTDKIVLSGTYTSESFTASGVTSTVVTINATSAGSAVSEAFIFSGTTTYNGGTLALMSTQSGVDLLLDSGLTVGSGNTLLVQSGGTATNLTLSGGGTADLESGAATLAGSLTFTSGSNDLVVSAVASSGDGDQAVISGFSASDKIDVTAISATGATLSFTTSTISSVTDEVVTISGTGGRESFIFAGTATYNSNTFALTSDGSGGAELTYNGGTTTSVTTSTASGTYTETSGNTLLVLSGGSISAATIDGGAFLVVNGGTDTAAVISSGGTETISAGSATGDQIAGSATVDTGGSVTSETVLSGGALTINGGTDSSATVSAYGTEKVLAGGSATADQIAGSATVSGGTVSSETVLDGGSLVISGGTDSSTTVSAGGSELVNAGSVTGDIVYGTLSTISGGTGAFASVTVESGGQFYLENGNSASNTTVLSGGELVVSGHNGSLTGTVLSGGGTLELDSPKATISGSLTFEAGSNTLEIASIASPTSAGVSYGDQATISGFSSTDKIDAPVISAAGASLSFAAPSGGTELVTLSGTGGSESFIFAGSAYDSFTLSVTSDTSGGAELVYNPNVSALTVSSGHTSSGITFGAGQTLTVQSGGTISATFIESGGLAVISGADNAATIQAGGSATVYGSATGDQIYGGVTVSSGGSVTSETVLGGGALNIGSNAVDSATTVTIGGTETVSAGSAAGDQVYGTLSTVSGAAATLTSETVQSGGTLDLYAGNNATGTIVQSGGTLVVSGAGTATNTVLNGSATLDLVTSDATLGGSLTFASGGNKLVVSAIASSGAGDQAVISGLSANDTIDVTAISVTGASLTFTSSGGNEIATISGMSGGAAVAESFIFSGTTTYNNFTLSITSDGSGGVDLEYSPAAASLTVSSGQTSTGIVVGENDTLTVQSGGTVSSTIVEADGVLVVSGVDVGATISSGGTETVSGSATGDQIYGSATVYDSVTSATVESGGSLTVSGGDDSATSILFGGTEIVSGGTASGDQVYGTQETVGGSAALTNETVYGGATIDLDDASTATGTTVLDGGTLVVSGSGTATNTVLGGGATLDLATSSATLSGSLTFVNDDTLVLGAVANSGAGDQAVISGFYLGDTINVTALGSGATLSFNSSGANEIVTISGANGSESLTFAGEQFSSSNMYLVTSGGQTDLETTAAAGFTVYNSADASSIVAGPLALYSVAADSILPTQMNEGFTEIDKKASAFDLITSEAALEEDLIDEIEPAVVGPDGQLYLLDGHHTFTALLDSSWGASNPTVYVNIVANYSSDTEQQFVAQMEANNWWLPLNDGVPETVNPNTGSPIPTSLTGLTNDVYRGLEYSILKQKDSRLFKNADNISGETGASTPGLDKMTGAYSDFLEAAAYQDADGGLGLPYLSPGDIALATQWNLNPDSTTTLPNVSGTVYAYQLPGFILSQNIVVSSVVSNATMGESSLVNGLLVNLSNDGAIDGSSSTGSFTAISEINAGTAANPILIGTPDIGFIMQLGNDRGYTVTLSNLNNTYTGGTTITAGTLIIAADGSLGAGTTESNQAFLNSLSSNLDSAGVPTNVDAAVQADNGIIFNSLTEGNGTLIIGTTSGEYTAADPFVTERPIAVGSEAATLDVNGSVVYLEGSLVTYGAYGVGIDTTTGEAPFTIDSFSGSSGGSPVASSGTLYLTVASPYMYGDIVIGDIGSPTVNVTADDELGNTTGAAALIGEVELNGGTLQTGASFTATERDLFLGNNGSFDVDGNVTSWGTLTDDGEKLEVENSSATSAGAVTFAALDIGDTAVLQLDGGTEGETVTFDDGIIRTNNDTLVIEPSTGASLGTTEQVFSGVGAASLVDTIAPVWIVDNNDSANGVGPYNFVTYGADGYVTATYNSTVLTASTGSDVIALGANLTANTNVAAYALNTEGNTIALGGNTLTIGDGNDAAGLILASGSAISNGTLAFGGSEGVIWVSGNNAAISAEITGTNGLTFSGSGTVAIGEAANVSGLITINSGTVSLTAANVFAGDVDGVTLANSADPAEATLNFTASQSFSTLNSAGTDSAITFSNGAGLTIGDSNDESSTYSGTITETGAVVNGALTIGGTGLVDLSGMSSKDLTLVAGSTIDVDSGASLRIEAKAITNANTIQVASGGELQFAENGGDVFAGNVTGQGEVMLLGGILQLTGTGNSYSGGTYVDLGSTLDLTTANVSTGNANIQDAGGFIDFDQNFSGLYSGVISDADQTGGDGGTTTEQGVLIKDDSANSNASSSNVTLEAVQAYSGATDIEAGTLTLDAVNTLADSSGVTLGRTGGAVDGQTAGLILEANNELASLSSNASNTTTVTLNGYVLTLDPTASALSDFGGAIVDGSATGSLVVDGLGDAELTGANTFSGGTTLDSGILELGANNSAGSGAITFGSASAMLRLDQTLSSGTTAFANTLTDLVVGDQIDLAGLQFESGTTTTTFSGSTLTVTNGTATESFTLSNPATVNFSVAADNTGGVLLTAETAVAPTITGAVAGQTTTSETAVTPFSGVTIGDANNSGTDTDTLTITYSGGGTLSGTGLSGSSGDYTLSGTAATVTSKLRALSFTPVDGVPNTSVTTTFTLSDKSSAYPTATVNSTTSVIDSDPAVAPTISGTKAGQTTNFEKPVTPFSSVVISDPNSSATDTLTITIGGAGGTLTGAGLSGSGSTYTLSGTAAAVTSELDALSFTPKAGAPNTTSTTTFTLSDKSSAYETATVNTTTSVLDSDAPAAPTITGTVPDQTTTSNTPIKPFSAVVIADPNPGATDTLTITVGGTGGTLTGAGLSGGTGGPYTLSGTAATVTSELDALSFTPKAGAPNTTSTTTFTLSDKSSGYATATVNSTTSVIDSDPAVAPTITGTKAGQTTTSEAPVKPFSGVTIADANNGGTDTDTLTITLSDSGATGTLSGTGLSGGTGGVYTLSGTAAAITTELDALSFKPIDGVAHTSVTTTFTLSDKSSAYATATVNNTTTVIDSDPAAPPTITSATPSVVEQGQTTVIGTVKPGIASATLSLKQTGGAGTLSLVTVNGVKEIIYTATANVTAGILDTVSYTIQDQYNDEATGSNTVPVAPVSDTIYVGTTGSSLNVGIGNSAIDGRAGNERIQAGNGNDVVFAGIDDTINLGNGDDTVLGGSNDAIQAGNGMDNISTGASSNVTLGSNAVTVTVGNNSTVGVGNGQDTVTAGTYATITGGNGQDTVTAGANATITLGNANDTITMGTGSSVSVGNGNDIVNAGMGDMITLGYGNDTVAFSGASLGAETIAGFGNNDVINFNPALFAAGMASFGTVMAETSNTSNGALITLPGSEGSVLLAGVKTASLTASNFKFTA